MRDSIVKITRNKYINTTRVFVRSSYTGIVSHWDFRSAQDARSYIKKVVGA
jgi:hypothetical protein